MTEPAGLPAYAAILKGSESYWLPRLVFQRGLGLVYLIAFLVAANQWIPLLGEHGLLPARLYLKRASFRAAPSLFFWWSSDAAFRAAAWAGIILSCVVLAGLADRYTNWFSALVWFVLWAIQLSFFHAGQTFYGFGWESMLAEAGFFAIFLGARNTAPIPITMWLLRWMEFRVMFGAGLIKLRGDPCWKQLTCLETFYETQPMPNPLSWYFHWLPRWVLHGGVVVNHVVELVVPFGLFAPQPVATICGLIIIGFQLVLMLGGNLSFLNLLTIVLAAPALDFRFLEKLVPIRPGLLVPAGPVLRYATIGLAMVVVALSVPVMLNLLSSRQLMNYSYNPLELVNTYGAFGSIGTERYEVIVEGTDAAALTPNAQWREYEFKGKPGDVRRRPPQIAPYHLRLDWLMWFAAMSQYGREPWFVNFMAKLLEGDRAALSLIARNPFPDHAPRFVRARLYRYRFTTPEERKQSGAWWKRELIGPYFPAVSLDTPGFRRVLEEEGWL
ncbi:MAG TPA: lipase maturation factor family protein [Bryobacteraceae bacterium]|nr:lipase maturation factor family protein [Bryobacteraceae bacterium]